MNFGPRDRRSRGSSSPAKLEAAADVAATDGVTERQVVDAIERLATKSLIEVDHEREEPRLRMLEPVRQYAAERLREAGEHYRPNVRFGYVSSRGKAPSRRLFASEVPFDPQRADGGCEAVVLRHEQAEFDHPAVVEMCRQRSPGGVVEVLGLDEGIDSSQ